MGETNPPIFFLRGGEGEDDDEAPSSNKSMSSECLSPRLLLQLLHCVSKIHHTLLFIYLHKILTNF